MEFGIPGYDDLVWDVSLVCDRIGSSSQHGLNGKLQLGDYLGARACIKINRYRRDYAVKNIAFAPAILSVASKIHPEFLRLLWVMADMQTVGALRQSGHAPVKVQSKNPDTPGSLREDRVGRDVGDLGSWVCLPWLARDETPGP